eukprot:GHVU01025700.1.p3 GENE.GHVU01025700.1~~GHVU01025700.1.p3  ORF type:complete len:113 (-),score=3.92 GHVU01025700.1:754-1092(-)
MVSCGSMGGLKPSGLHCCGLGSCYGWAPHTSASSGAALRASPPPPEEVKPEEGGRIHDVGLSSSFVIRHSSSLWSGDQVAFVLVVAVMTNYHLIINLSERYSIICPHYVLRV